jgi:hypothetical protein
MYFQAKNTLKIIIKIMFWNKEKDASRFLCEMDYSMAIIFLLACSAQ